MKQPIRAFAIGLFTAGFVLIVVNYFSNSEEIDLSEIPEEDMIEQLKEESYRVLTESEYITLSVNKDNEEDEESEENSEEPSLGEENDGEQGNDEDQEEVEEESEEEEIEEEEVEDEPEEEEEEEDDSTEEETTISYTFTIESGMALSSITSDLEANNIIDDASEFNQYLEDEEYSSKIQLGEFTVTNEMSFFELAEILTTLP